MLTAGGRPPFVGRQSELALLSERLAAAGRGEGAIVLLAGEPGIGKTRLAEELAAGALAGGARVLWGRCWEGEGAPAFWPWVEALRGYVRDTPPAHLREDLGEGAADVARIVPELRQRLAGLPPPVPLEAEQSRFRLFDAITGFLRGAAQRRPLLLVLDDLHWADEPSLVLLQFLARELAGAPLLALGTYRDTELHAAHPLTGVLAALRRSRAFTRLTLRGLSAPQVQDLIDAVALPSAAAAGPALARALHDETEGNPFFIQEVLRHLSESAGSVNEQSAGELPTFDIASVHALGIPDGVREVILRRLARLAPAVAATLSAAAVIGREFGVSALARVARLMPETLAAAALFDALDEAEAARLIAPVPAAPGVYRFAHALIRETLYGELTSVRRLRLHRQVGAALEALYAADPEAHLEELAHHFFLAAGDGDAAPAFAYALRAAVRATRLLAYEAAARHYRLALQALALCGAGETAQRCDLLLALGEAQSRAGDTPAARTTFAQAAALARALTAPAAFARAALGFGGPVVTVGVVDEALVRLLEEALALLGVADRALRARLLGRLAMELLYAEDRARREAVSRAAVALARKAGDHAALGFTLNAHHYAIWEPGTLQERLAVATEIVAMGEAAGDTDLMLQGRRWRAPDLLEAGRRADADAEIAALAAQATAARQPLYLWYTAVFRGAQALLDGRLSEAAALVEQGFAAGERAQSGTAGIYYHAQRFVLLRELGRLGDLEPWLRAAHTSTLPVLRCMLIWQLIDTDRLLEARAYLDALAGDRFAGVRRDLTWLASLALLAEICERLGEPARAAVLYEQLLPYARWNVMIGIPAYLGSAARYLGLLAAAQRRWAPAVAHYEAALAANAQLGAAGWLAHTCHDYARLLLARGGPGDAAQARALLTEARSAARARGMVWLERQVNAGLASLGATAGNAPARRAAARPNGLTARELDVLRLIAAGRTTREIAAALVVSEPTVERHITNLYGKIGARGRADATAYALGHDLAGT